MLNWRNLLHHHINDDKTISPVAKADRAWLLDRDYRVIISTFANKNSPLRYQRKDNDVSLDIEELFTSLNDSDVQLIKTHYTYMVYFSLEDWLIFCSLDESKGWIFYQLYGWECRNPLDSSAK